MSAMTERFQRSRWAPTRQEIERMGAGQTITFPDSEYFDCKSSVERLNDAYGSARKWTLKNRTEVTRIK